LQETSEDRREEMKPTPNNKVVGTRIVTNRAFSKEDMIKNFNIGFKQGQEAERKRILEIIDRIAVYCSYLGKNVGWGDYACKVNELKQQIEDTSKDLPSTNDKKEVKGKEKK
jgi:hypothetical protein